MRPSPFFRSWVLAYACAIPVTIGVAVEWAIGSSLVLVTWNHAFSFLASWFQFRMGQQLLGRPMPGVRVAVVMALVLACGPGLWLHGDGYQASVIPASLMIMVTNTWLGATMIRAGRTPDHAGMAWIGIPVMLHGLWLLTYPAAVATQLVWAGFGIEAMMEICVGIGMTIYVLQRTVHQVEGQNAALLLAEQELRESQADRERLQKQRIAHLEELDALKRDLLNTTSHELRTPLTSILGYAEFLSDETAGPLVGEQPEYVAQIKKAALRLRRIVDDLLDNARLDAGTFLVALRPLDLRTVVKFETSSLRPQARDKGVQLEIDLPDSPCMTLADPQSLGQVLLNLVNNAVKFTPSGGTVRLRVQQLDGPIRVEVTDTGIGIASEHLPRLFEKYYQVDPSLGRELGGTGLGLAICRAIVEAHGGRIGVESTIGAGSTFWFTLPAPGQAG